MALVVDIADAVVEELKAGEFNPPFTPVRRVLPEYELTELETLRVTVVPRALEVTGSTRATSWIDCRIDIGVQQRVGNDLEAGVATLCGLLDALAQYLRRRPLAAAPGAVWVRSVNDPVYVPEHLAELRTFTSVLAVTYRSVG